MPKSPDLPTQTAKKTIPKARLACGPETFDTAGAQLVLWDTRDRRSQMRFLARDGEVLAAHFRGGSMSATSVCTISARGVRKVIRFLTSDETINDQILLNDRLGRRGQLLIDHTGIAVISRGLYVTFKTGPRQRAKIATFFTAAQGNS